MKDIKAVGLGTLAKKLGICKKRLSCGGPFLKDDYDLMGEIQRRLNFMHDNRYKCDCNKVMWSDECAHLEVRGTCLLKVK